MVETSSGASLGLLCTRHPLSSAPARSTPCVHPRAAGTTTPAPGSPATAALAVRGGDTPRWCFTPPWPAALVEPYTATSGHHRGAFGRGVGAPVSAPDRRPRGPANGRARDCALVTGRQLRGGSGGPQKFLAMGHALCYTTHHDSLCVVCASCAALGSKGMAAGTRSCATASESCRDVAEA